MNDALELTFPNELRFFALVRLVLSGLAAQLDLPYERVDDLQLAVEGALAGKSPPGAKVTLRIEPRPEALCVSISPIEAVPASGAQDTNGAFGFDRIAEKLVDSVEVVSVDGTEWLRLEKRILGNSPVELVTSTAGESRVTLVAPARAEYLVCFRLVLVGLARAGGIDEETLSDLKLAVTEACSNSVRHAYGDDGGRVSARFDLSDDYLAFEVEDDGPGFELDALETPGLPAPGLGLSIIQALTEDFSVSRGPGGRGSRVSFRKPI